MAQRGTPQTCNSHRPGWASLAACDQTRVQMAALRDEELLVVNLDIPSLVTQVRAALPELRQLEARIVARWRQAPPARVDRLERYSWALEHTHGPCQGLEVPHRNSTPLVRELRALRWRILDDLRVLVRTSVLDESLLEPFGDVQSHRSLASSVCELVALCRAHWPQIENQSPLTTDELSQAFARAMALMQQLPRRRRLPEASLCALRERRQAFTLVVREYTEFRRAAQFLCATKAEVDRIAPSLYRKKRRTQNGS